MHYIVDNHLDCDDVCLRSWEKWSSLLFIQDDTFYFEQGKTKKIQSLRSQVKQTGGDKAVLSKFSSQVEVRKIEQVECRSGSEVVVIQFRDESSKTSQLSFATRDQKQAREDAQYFATRFGLSHEPEKQYDSAMSQFYVPLILFGLYSPLLGLMYYVSRQSPGQGSSTSTGKARFFRDIASGLGSTGMLSLIGIAVLFTLIWGLWCVWHRPIRFIFKRPDSHRLTLNRPNV